MGLSPSQDEEDTVSNTPKLGTGLVNVESTVALVL